VARVVARLDGGLRVRVSDGTHTWLADEPPEKGGEDAGPNPYELLLSGLAACTAVTIRMYADHKGLPVEDVAVTAEYDRVHADDCAECAEGTIGHVNRIAVDVTVTGDLDDAARARLTQVARRCPVHATLEKGVVFADAISFEATTADAG
jgi:putative redox protein